jgi:hypothetical protein
MHSASGLYDEEQRGKPKVQNYPLGPNSELSGLARLQIRKGD